LSRQTARVSGAGIGMRSISAWRDLDSGSSRTSPRPC
jgi:hypothetical protein